MDNLVYIPGDEPEKPAALRRYLPDIPEGVRGGLSWPGISNQGGLDRGAWMLDRWAPHPSWRSK